jgi:glutathione synthase/RimK-type ligase-like ATP-grasp enzyme
MPRIALLTLEDRAGFVFDDELALAECTRRGWDAQEIPWTRADITWTDFDLVIVRTTWDYFHRPTEFLEVLRTIESSGARLENPRNVIEWNLDKRYLRELEAAGVPIVPSVWGHGGDATVFTGLFTALHDTEIVLKPTVSAGAKDTFRLRAPLSAERAIALADTFADRDWFAQPFVRSVVTEGEYSVFYFNGAFSHACQKVPKPGDFRVQEEHGGDIRRITVPDDVRAVSDRVIAAIAPAPLQARVDLVRLANGTLGLMELELIEPSLYLRTDPSAPRNFVDAVDALLQYSPT